MATKNEVLKLALDTMNGSVSGEFSKKEQAEAIRAGLIDLNGGSTKLSARDFRPGNAVFEIIQEILPVAIEGGLKEDDFFFNMVDYRNLAEGDMNEFWTEDNSLLFVGDVAQGSQALRRQRLNGGSKISLTTKLKGIKVYEEMRRLMAGRVDFNTLIDRASYSFTNQMRNDIYAAFAGINAATAGLSETYVKTGSWDADTLMDIIAHVEASTGKAATVMGTKKALRKIQDATQSDEAKSDLYNIGFYGKFYGTPLVSVKQIHKTNSDEFLLPDDKLWILASEDKPVKCVNEGEGLLIQRESLENADLTQEWAWYQAYGCGVICNEKMGIYTIEG